MKNKIAFFLTVMSFLTLYACSNLNQELSQLSDIQDRVGQKIKSVTDNPDFSDLKAQATSALGFLKQQGTKLESISSKEYEQAKNETQKAIASSERLLESININSEKLANLKNQLKTATGTAKDQIQKQIDDLTVIISGYTERLASYGEELNKLRVEPTTPKKQ